MSLGIQQVSNSVELHFYLLQPSPSDQDARCLIERGWTQFHEVCKALGLFKSYVSALYCITL